jgi:ABC-2 type transport system ATP-binding protein
MAAIEIERLTKHYPGGRGVTDVDLHIEAGEVFGFIGPNGAGKSTTIRAVLGLLRPTSGTARILGVDAVREGQRARAAVGYVPSETNLYDGFTVQETLDYVASLRGGAGNATRRQQLCDALDLDVRRDVSDLSLGNKKKVALVLALEHSPAVLILDEPTGGLDPLVQARLFDILLAEQRAGVTVFFSSHVLAEVQRACSRVAILKDGRVLSVSSVDELRARQQKRVHAVVGQAGLAATTALPGVRDLRHEGARASFLFRGVIADLLSRLAADGVLDVSIDEPSLEEVFLQHYTHEAGGSHDNA